MHVKAVSMLPDDEIVKSNWPLCQFLVNRPVQIIMRQTHQLLLYLRHKSTFSETNACQSGIHAAG